MRAESRAYGRLALAMLAYPAIAVVVITCAGASFGVIASFAIGVPALLGYFVLLRRLYRSADRISERSRIRRREQYRGIYRVKAPPVSDWVWLPENIRMGDCAWEMEPLRKDKLIYLHGLEEQWGVVWKAGFRREDVEYIGPKPVSQYDWRDFEYEGPKPYAYYHWSLVKAKTPCPYAVVPKARKVYHWQFPV